MVRDGAIGVVVCVCEGRGVQRLSGRVFMSRFAG